MPRAEADPGVGVHVLDDVSDVLDAVLLAPVAERMAERVAVELRDGVHIGVPDVAGDPAHTEPERRQIRLRRRSERLGHHRGDPVIPRQRESRYADAHIVDAVILDVRHVPVVAEQRLVREKALDGGAEAVAVVRVMRLVDGVDLQAHRFGTEHIDVVLPDGAAPGAVEEEHAPDAARHGKMQEMPADAVRQAEGLRGAVLVRSRAGVGVHAEQHMLVIRLLRGQERIGKRPRNVHMALDELPAAHFGVRGDASPGMPRRKMVVVEDPDLHSALFGLLEDAVHVAPPGFPGKILVRTRLDAERARAALIDPLHFLGNGVIVIAVLPVERQHIVFFVSG